ncbi:MAG TPA: hypothetical protein VFW23_14950, partial [Tepidisphaeraceae bacterium]|nr:hypothetical protein [Tepidisphaeraceae bacterium]
MGLFDGFVPQGFADRGGMLGRLLSLRPDLAQDGEGTDQPPPDQTVQAPGQHPNDISTSSPASSAIGSALDDFYRQTILQGAKDVTGYASDAIHDPLYFLHAIGPSLGGLGPVASELPGAVKGVLGTVGLARSAAPPEADHPLEIAGSAVRDTRTVAAPSVGGASVGPVGSSGSNSLGPMQRGLLPGLGLAAALASRKSSELLAGARRPIAPVFPEPPVAPVPPQTPSMPPHAVPAAPQTGPIPPGPTSAPGLIPTPPSSDDGEDALGPAWQQWQSFL